MAGELARPIGETNYGSYERDSTMASMGLSPITLAGTPQDHTDEAYEAELSRRMHGRQDEVVDRFLELLADACYRTDGNALGEMHTCCGLQWKRVRLAIM
jgi:hypothetical protein